MRISRIRRGMGTVNFTTHPVDLTPWKIAKKIRIHIISILTNTFQLNAPVKSSGDVAAGDKEI